MAHGADRLAGPDEGFDQPDGGRVVGHVPHWAVSAGIEDRIEVLRRHIGKPFRVGELRIGRGISAKAVGQLSLIFGQIAFRIEWRLAALRRSERDLRTRILQHIERSGEFFQPETGFLSGITELVMGGENEEDFHIG